MDRTEFPTSNRLEQLRRAGVVPISARSIAALSAFGFCVGVMIGSEDLGKILLPLLKSPDSGAIATLKSIDLTVLFRIFYLPLVLAFFFVFVGGLLQSRFLLSWSLVSPLFSRLQPSGRRRRRTFLDVIVSVVSPVLFIVLVVSVAALFFFRKFATLLNRPPEFAWRELSRQFAVFPLMILILLAFVAFFAWLAERFLFMLRYRMSRSEVLKERGR